MDGKCEVNPEKDCVWETIFSKLEKTGRLVATGKIWTIEEISK
ncbi:MAG: methylenetetrahydrofolate reductase C-terminal domain-containing protein [Methanolobus sp.]